MEPATAPIQEHLQIAMVDGVDWIKISGRADFTWSIHFKNLVAELWRRGHRKIILELRDCTNMDSTFLGDLTKIGVMVAEENRLREGDGAFIELANLRARVFDSLESLGVASLFKVIQVTDPARENFTPCVESGSANRKEITRNCLEAHKTLMALKPENAIKFRHVAEFLAEDLKRQEQRKES